MRYLALLRGINVGGNTLIKMSDLKDALEKTDFQDVKTYIQSGNVLFTSAKKDKLQLAKDMQKVIKVSFKHEVDIIIFTTKEWQNIVKAAPKWWGQDTAWKHNLFVMTSKHDMKQVVEAIGKLKPDIEKVEPGLGVVYQSLSLKDFGKAVSGRIAGNPIYKQMTIRNYNTATKLAVLMSDSDN